MAGRAYVPLNTTFPPSARGSMLERAQARRRRRRDRAEQLPEVLADGASNPACWCSHPSTRTSPRSRRGCRGTPCSARTTFRTRTPGSAPDVQADGLADLTSDLRQHRHAEGRDDQPRRRAPLRRADGRALRPDRTGPLLADAPADNRRVGLRPVLRLAGRRMRLLPGPPHAAQAGRLDPRRGPDAVVLGASLGVIMRRLGQLKPGKSPTCAGACSPARRCRSSSRRRGRRPRRSPSSRTSTARPRVTVVCVLHRFDPAGGEGEQGTGADLQGLCRA